MDAPPTCVGSNCSTIRRIGGREREVTTESPNTIRRSGGPIEASTVRSGPSVAVTVDPLADGSRSRLTIELDFTGHGIGKLLVPVIVRRQTASEMPRT